MEYVYAGMWLLVGLILIFRMGKENKVFYLAGAFFLVLGGWWGANIFTQEDLFSGMDIPEERFPRWCCFAWCFGSITKLTVNGFKKNRKQPERAA